MLFHSNSSNLLSNRSPNRYFLFWFLIVWHAFRLTVFISLCFNNAPLDRQHSKHLENMKCSLRSKHTRDIK
ncbi:hypothetical protein ANCCAN_03920 [Ancylostoma caninum]|uniref:Uncharacterized protein n=1 Tax=Ancylostoma caninum TaxID=29170 RepID=A0A368H3N7_ANCCA|nr:hypothetical protein ANCCAN_03920 [Ancylostoma caninum]